MRKSTETERCTDNNVSGEMTVGFRTGSRVHTPPSSETSRRPPTVHSIRHSYLAGPPCRWTVRDHSSSAAAQCSAGHPPVLHQWSQDAAHRTLPAGHCPTGRCPTGRCPTGRCPTGRCPQDAARRTLPHRTLPHRTLPHRTMPTGRCPQDAAPQDAAPQDAVGWIDLGHFGLNIQCNPCDVSREYGCSPPMGVYSGLETSYPNSYSTLNGYPVPFRQQQTNKVTSALLKVDCRGRYEAVVSLHRQRLQSRSVMPLSAVPEWGEKLEGEKQVEDEFTCPGVLRGALLDLKSTVERVFRVILNIGGGEDAFTPQDGLIWLQLKGRKGEVEAAKGTIYYTETTGDYTDTTGDYTETTCDYTETTCDYTETTGDYTETTGDYTETTGYYTETTGDYTETTGYYTETTGDYTETTGDYTETTGYYTETTGDYTETTGDYTETTGYYTETTGYYTETTGDYTETTGYYTETTGAYTETTEDYTETTGDYTETTGDYTETTGDYTEFTGDYTETTGYYTETTGYYTETTGYYTETTGDYTETTGDYTETTGDYTETTGDYTETTAYYIETTDYHTETTGYHTETTGDYTETTGYHTETTGYYTETTGYYTETTDYYTETTGDYAETTGDYTETTGYYTETTGYYTETTDYYTETTGDYTETTGYYTETTGYYTETTDYYTETTGDYTETTGYYTETTGYYTETTDYYTETTGDYAETTGDYTETTGYYTETTGYYTETTDYYTETTGDYAETTGYYTETTGYYTETTDYYTETTGDYAETTGDYTETTGYYTETTGDYTETTDYYTETTGDYAETTGDYTETTGDYTETTGYYTETTGDYTETTDYYTETTGDYTETTGYYTETTDYYTETTGDYAETTGYYTETTGYYTETTDYYTETTGDYAETTGDYTETTGYHTETTGYYTETTGDYTETTGDYTETTAYYIETTDYHTETTGYHTETTGDYTETTGYHTETTGYYTETTGYYTETTDYYTETTGDYAETTGDYTETTGYYTETTGYYTETTDYYTETTGDYTETTGYYTETTGYYTETTDYYTETTEDYTETTGDYTETTGYHTETTGYYTETTGDYTETTGYYTETTGDYTETTEDYTETTEDYTEATGYHTETTEDYTETTEDYTETTGGLQSRVFLYVPQLFVKGAANQETQNEVQYPETLYSVFCGAKGLFVDCLIRMTSAHIVLGSIGCLLISGLAEPVVKANSLITDLVDKYRNSQAQLTATPGESLDSRRAFKSLVEGLEDSHTLDLLVLPVRVKEVLLDLVEQSGVDPSSLESASPGSKTLLGLQENMDRRMLRAPPENRTPDVLRNSTFPVIPNGTPHVPSRTPPSALLSQSYLITDNQDQPREEAGSRGPSHDNFFRCFVGEVASGVHSEGTNGKPQVREAPKFREGVLQDAEELQESEQQEENLLSAGSKQENEHLLKFFTAMGYDEQVVYRVLSRTGPREASQLLDLIQQEQDKSGIWIEHGNSRASDQKALPGTTGEASVGVNGAPVAGEDDFVLGVVKKAAASCGYSEDNVVEVYSNASDLTPHEFIDKLQRMREPENGGDDARRRAEEMEEQQRKAIALQKARERDFKEERRVDRKSEATKPEMPENHRGVSVREKSKMEGVPGGGRESAGLEPRLQEPVVPMESMDWFKKLQYTPVFQNQPGQTIPPSIRGPPQPSYPLPMPPTFADQQVIAPIEHPTTRPKHKHGPPPGKSGAVVTGAQRFLESLEKPFKLQLRNDPGDSGLRQIIIDGSNVAMSHGLGTFFSCRGIALAVQYFWNRGHREISVLVPQWRQKKDPKITEQHFLAELQDLGLLSFTPSREVNGQRINSYDDRLMLQCAQQTNGVIVTNDNMRDLVDESAAWKEIIKKRECEGSACAAGCQQRATAVRHWYSRGLRIPEGLGIFSLRKEMACIGLLDDYPRECEGSACAAGCQQRATAVRHWYSRGPEIPEGLGTSSLRKEMACIGLLDDYPRECEGSACAAGCQQRATAVRHWYSRGLRIPEGLGTSSLRKEMACIGQLDDSPRECEGLLQYLFAGDMFMVPDDPLGRSGPHLNDFLRTQNSTPVPGSHSFAGVPSSFSLPAPQPRANTEVLQYRERTPGGRPHKSGRGPPKAERTANRSAEETLRLKQELVQIFPGQESVVMMTLQCHPNITDINELSSFILEQQDEKTE
ncbi:hypothetical protein NFI96_025213 [Prochilodus magdalenae]|nr:hypothetical protein NFI96_025213 [Prochilodus magdalenae]